MTRTKKPADTIVEKVSIEEVRKTDPAFADLIVTLSRQVQGQRPENVLTAMTEVLANFIGENYRVEEMQKHMLDVCRSLCNVVTTIIRDKTPKPRGSASVRGRRRRSRTQTTAEDSDTRMMEMFARLHEAVAPDDRFNMDTIRALFIYLSSVLVTAIHRGLLESEYVDGLTVEFRRSIALGVQSQKESGNNIH